MSELISAIIAGIAQGMPLFIVASGLTLIFGVLRVLNFAHGAFFMLGAFLLATMLSGGADNLAVFLLAALAAAAVLAVVGVAADTAVFKRLYGQDHMITLLASYALLLGLEGLTTMLWGNKPRSQAPVDGLGGSLSVGRVEVASYDVFLLVVGLAIGAGLYLLLQRTRYGKVIRAVSTDELMARALGIRARRVQAGVFALGAALAGLSGALMAPLLSVDVGLAPTYAIQSFAIVIIGGLGSVGGALTAALILGIADSLMVSYVPDVAGFSLYIAVALILLLRPQGLAGRPVGSAA
ncbi:MAG TPA: branched-chain amino acid ABC transporter permease [Nocardioides sp.]|nr:branched-chain amino acid ABC transporter permease [Nocardioides sp.]